MIRGTYKMLEFKEITWDNFWEVAGLKVSKEQEKYIHSSVLFMAQSYLNEKMKFEDYSLAIYEGDTLVGFTKIVYVPKNVEPYHFAFDSYMIDALMIDEGYQGRGLGSKALEAIIGMIECTLMHKHLDITLACYKDNLKGKTLFEHYGFHKIGVKDSSKGLDLYKRSNKS